VFFRICIGTFIPKPYTHAHYRVGSFIRRTSQACARRVYLRKYRRFVFLIHRKADFLRRSQVVVHGQDVITSYRHPPDMSFRVHRGYSRCGNYNFSNWVTTPSGYWKYTCDSDDPYNIRSAIIAHRLGIKRKQFRRLQRYYTPI